MTYERKNQGVCSRSTTVTLQDGVIENVEVVGGCNGNLQGVCTLLRGVPAAEAIERLKGIRCGMKSTSCPDQIARTLEEALAK